MTKIKNEPTLKDNELVNEVRNAIEHRATWMGLMMDEAKKADQDWEAIGRAAISRCGCFHGGRIFEKMNEKGNIEEFKTAFLTDLGQKLFEMEITEVTDDTLKVEFNYCALVSAWLKQNLDGETIETLCDMAMDGDRGIAETTGFNFELGKTIAKGDPICELCFTKKK